MIVLDTHVLIWWVSEPQKLSKKVHQTIEKNLKRNQLFVSSISIWEIYMLVKKGRLSLSLAPEDWIEKLEQLPLQFIPMDNQIAARSVSLPDPLHADFADRIIVATALEQGAILVTSDKKILNYPHVRTLW